MKLMIGDNFPNNPLMIMQIKEIVKKEEIYEDGKWSIRKDRTGAFMVFYENIPAEEIIFAVGEMHLAQGMKELFQLQQDYYDEGYADTYNAAMKVIRDDDFAKEFYQKYKELDNKL